MYSFRSDNSGSTNLVFALLLVPLLGAIGLATDYSNWNDKKSQLQIAADSAALAGAATFSNGDGTEIAAEQTASIYLASVNAAASAGISTTVLVNGAQKTVEVQLNAPGQRSFSAFFLQRDPILSVNAKARTTGRGNPICILALDPSMNGAFLGSGGTDVIAENCTVQVNSNSGSAVTFSGNSTITAGENCFVGGVSQGLPLMTPQPKKPCAPVADPFAGYSAPTVGPCDHTNFKVSGGSPVLSPGVYCGGITLSSVTIATLNPGVYVIKDGLFTISGGGRLVGVGVALYLTGNNAGLNWSGGGSYHLAAPSSGDLAGFVVFLDPAAAQASKTVISGSGEMYYEGILYFPDQKVEVSGTGMTTGLASPWSVYVAKNFLYSGGSQLVVKADPSATSVYIPPEINALLTAGNGTTVLVE